MRLLIGNFKGPEGKQGEKGDAGETGATGQRGSRWTSGTAVTGTSAVGTIFPGTGITDARMYDYYINPDTGNVYECTAEGTADVAEWTHIGNIKGPKGATGPAGSISDIDNQKPTYTEAAKLENISSGETVKVAFGKLRKAVAVLIAHYTQKATASILGHVKLSNSAAITTAGEYALDAIEKNASVNGTLANQIGTINGSLSEKAVTKSGHLQGVSGSVATINLAPFTNYLFFAYTYVYFIQTYSRSFEYYGIIPAPEDFITLNNVDGLNLKIIKNIGSSFYATILNMGKNNYNFLDT